MRARACRAMRVRCRLKISRSRASRACCCRLATNSFMAIRIIRERLLARPDVFLEISSKDLSVSSSIVIALVFSIMNNPAASSGVSSIKLPISLTPQAARDSTLVGLKLMSLQDLYNMITLSSKVLTISTENHWAARFRGPQWTAHGLNRPTIPRIRRRRSDHEVLCQFGIGFRTGPAVASIWEG